MLKGTFHFKESKLSFKEFSQPIRVGRAFCQCYLMNFKLLIEKECLLNSYFKLFKIPEFPFSGEINGKN